eukprot:705585-Hanusia_phi.AAC.1
MPALRILLDAPRVLLLPSSSYSTLPPPPSSSSSSSLMCQGSPLAKVNPLQVGQYLLSLLEEVCPQLSFSFLNLLPHSASHPGGSGGSQGRGREQREQESEVEHRHSHL